MTIGPEGAAVLAQVAATVLVALVFSAKRAPEESRTTAGWWIPTLVNILAAVFLLGVTVASTISAVSRVSLTNAPVSIFAVTGVLTLVSLSLHLGEPPFGPVFREHRSVRVAASEVTPEIRVTTSERVTGCSCMPASPRSDRGWRAAVLLDAAVLAVQAVATVRCREDQRSRRRSEAGGSGSR